MPEALTESFCERCGTRYEFAAPSQLNTIRKTRGLISGLKNYIMSQDALGDAVGDAMRSEEASLASKQLEAFHESFNFCIDCRQYTCVNCWNDSSGRCRSCKPIPGTDDLLERFEATFHAGHADLAESTMAAMSDDEIQRRLGVEAWPSSDLPEPAIEEPLLVAEATEPEPEPVFEEPIRVAEVTEPEPVIEEPLLVAEAPEGVGWEGDATWELLPEPEPEPEPIVEEPLLVAEATEPEPEPEPVIEEPLLVAEATEPEPEPEPEPVIEERPRPAPIRPISETIIRLPRPAPEQAPADDDRIAAAARADEDPAAAARRAQLDLLGLGDPGEGPVAPTRPNVVPYRSRGTAPSAAELAALGETAPEVARGFWDASAREVAAAMTQVGVQACGECGLSLSASARFCRRCGTRQARSA